MADLKISQLTAVTTPLAGTEVLPIVQSSTTKKATVSEILNSTQPTQSAYGVTYLNASKIQETGSTLQFVSGELRVNTNGAAIKIGGFDGYLYGSGSGTSKIQISNGNADIAINGSNSINLQSAGTTRLNVAVGGDISVSTGDLKISGAGKAIVFAGNGSVLWRCGAGTPEGAVTAPVGSLFTRTDGGASTTLYVKESGTGNTGWVAK